MHRPRAPQGWGDHSRREWCDSASTDGDFRLENPPVRPRSTPTRWIGSEWRARPWGCCQRDEMGTKIVAPTTIAVSHLSRTNDLMLFGRSGGTRTPNPRFWRPVIRHFQPITSRNIARPGPFENACAMPVSLTRCVTGGNAR